MNQIDPAEWAAKHGIDPEDEVTLAALRALLIREHPREEPIPSFGCSCGIYAAKTIGRLADEVLAARRYSTAVVGVVLLWGRIVEHDAGYRAAMASVGAFYRPVGRAEAYRVTADTAERAADAFGVPCIPCIPWRLVPGPGTDAA